MIKFHGAHVRDKIKGGPSRIDTMPDGFAALLGRQPLAVGDVIGARYKLLRSLGNGGMGQVFVAENVAIGMRVAVKLLKPELLINRELRQRFQNEAQAVAAIEHPNVARFFDLVVGDPTFIVMEYVRGETLAALLARGPLPLERAVGIARRLCWGLEAAHAAGVVHRDLKPANVLLAADAEHGETPKLIDFGLAKLAATVGDSQLTRTGQIIGTPNYMSPEQISGREIDGRADVYALGCVLYEMLTGRPPFAGSGDDDVQIFYRQMHEPPPPLAPRLPEAPAALEALLRRALQKDPERRFASMKAMASALATVVPEPTTARPSGTSGVRVDRTGRVLLASRAAAPARVRSWLAWAALTTLLVVVAAVAGVVRGRRVPPSPTSGSLLVVTTQPPGARVTLDGRALDETTPTARRGLGGGAHVVMLRREGYAPVDRTLTLADGERQSLDVVLPPSTRGLEVATVPAGASLYVDGRLVPATTPTTVLLTDDDFHELRAERAGYESLTRALKPEEREPTLTLTLEPERQPRGTLVVDAPERAEVWLDGVATGLTTPTLGFRVAAGAHVVELRGASGERSPSKKVRVERGHTQRLSLALAPGERR